MITGRILYPLTAIVISFTACTSPARKAYTGWEVTGGSRENIRYSSLTDIDTGNVEGLEVAWVYHSEKQDSTKYGPMQCNPVIVDGVLYGVSPRLNLFAIDAATGQEKWTFRPADSTVSPIWHRNSVNMNRGVAYWANGDDKRILYTVGPVVFSINALTGKPVRSFGQDGGISLNNGLGRDSARVFIAATSPLMIYKDLFFVSGQVGEETPGHIRAFDVRTGRQKWIFHTIPYPGEPGYETWEDTTAYRHMGSTNSWAGFSLDEARGILFAPTGNPSNDFYGGQRRGAGLYGNCLLAIDAVTGKLIWHFQTVHHDVWDMDIPAAPSLFTWVKNGKKTDAVAQTTKTGFVFVFDRETGAPLFPVEERPVPTQTALAEEKLWETQPYPVKPAPFARQTITAADLNPLVPDTSRQDILTRFNSYHSGKMFTPPSKEGTVILPGYDGGGEWGGASVDPETNILYVNANEMAWVLTMVDSKPDEVKKRTVLEAGVLLYNQYCMGCHGPERLGGGDYPGIIGVEKKYTHRQFTDLLTTGRRMMPGLPQLTTAEKDAIAAFVLDIKQKQAQEYKGPVRKDGAPPKSLYGFTGYNKFLTKEKYPAIKPPWGTLNAIDLNTGEYVWKIPFGAFEELTAKGIPETGRENYGGPVTTAGGLLFIAASEDGYMRAYNKRNGRLLWKFKLPAPGLATPAVYAVNGKQYVVIACGGSKWGGKSSDAYVAFALPGNKPNQ